MTSLGIGGTNAHVILEEAPITGSGPSRPWQLLTLSAKRPSALDAMATELAEHLVENSPALADVAFTTHLGRKAFRFRRAVICSDSSGAAETISVGHTKKVVSGSSSESEPPVIFLCTGQGAQYVSSGRGLYESEPVFRSTVDFCADYLKQFIGIDLRTVLFPSDDEADAAAELLNQTRFTQPALFVLEYATAKLWSSWGVEPSAMIGHSVGEFAAACIAGVFSLEAGLQIIAERGRLIQSMPGGSMTAVPMPERQVLPLLNGKLSLASVNADGQCVVSGPDGAIENLEKSLADKGMEYRRLRVSHAFHSAMMEPILHEFAGFVGRFDLAAPRIPYISSATGTWITEAEAKNPNYWARQLRQTVRFAEGIGQALRTPGAILLEVGPGNTLSALCEQNAAFTDSHKAISSMRTRTDSISDGEFITGALAELWVAGKKIDWKGYHAHEQRRRLPIPTYPFEREHFWIEPGTSVEPVAALSAESAKEGREIGFFSPSWKRVDSIAKNLTHDAGPWLIFEDAQGLGARIAKTVRRRGEECFTVRPGPNFARPESHRFEIDPGKPDDYQMLLSQLAEKKALPRSVVHLWSVCDPTEAMESLDDLPTSETMSFYSLLFLAQALEGFDLAGPVQIAVVSNNLQQVAGEPILRPSRALIAGPCGVIPKELSDVRCINVDVQISDSDSVKEAAQQVVAELLARSTESPVAYRKHRRWLQTFPRLRGQGKRPSITLREGGVYLITGGLGGIGLTLAESITKSVRARLVLLGRSAGHPSAEQARKIRALEEAGAEVLVIAEDVCDPKAMRRAADQIHARFGPISGIIHSAGLIDDAPLLQKDRTGAARVLAPKVRGTFVLESVFQHDPIDFFILMSSVSSHLAPAGQLDYAAANSFMDAFASSRSQHRSRYVSIQWPRWTDVGMAAIASDDEHADASHPLLGRAQRGREDLTLYSSTLRLSDWIVGEHRLASGTGLFPATGYLEMVRAAMKDLTGSSAMSISDFNLSQPLRVRADSEQPVRLLMRKEDNLYRFSAHTYLDSWIECASGEVVAGVVTPQPPRFDIDAVRKRCASRMLGLESPPRNEAQARHIQFGAHWLCTKRVWLGTDEALSLLELPAEFASETNTYQLHPALLDMATGSAMFLIKRNEAAGHLYCSPLLRRRGGSRTASCNVLRLCKEQVRDFDRESHSDVRRLRSRFGRQRYRRDPRFLDPPGT